MNVQNLDGTIGCNLIELERNWTLKNWSLVVCMSVNILQNSLDQMIVYHQKQNLALHICLIWLIGS